MNGKNLSVVLMLLIMLVACFVTGPVLSGEHPWDSDRGGGGDKDDPPDWKYDTIIIPKDSVYIESAPTTTNSSVFWYSWYSSISWVLSSGF